MQIGIALGGGGARGWAHIGALRTLERAGLSPSIVAGTSIGAIVGGAFLGHHCVTWCFDYSPVTIEPLGP